MLGGWKLMWRALAAVVLAVGVIPGVATAAPQAPLHRWDATTLTVEPLGGALQLGAVAYRGHFQVRVEGGVVKVVNELPVEDYVRGIREVPPSWPIEAQRAQAIAARSYALHQATRARAEGRRSDLCATAACQVYAGIPAEQRGGPQWARAVESTTAQVLAFRGAPILAMYSSSNGGRSVAGSKPYLRSVPDPDDAASPHHRWRVEVPELAIGSAVDLPVGAVLTGVERDGPVVIARWAGPDTTSLETARPIPVAEFRNRLEAAHPAPPELPRLLPSTAFGLTAGSVDGQIAIEGQGWGHGMGMSQHGSLGKARRGMKAAEILAFYYAGLRPVTAGPGQVPETIRVEIAATTTTQLAGQGDFRVLADGRPLATGSGPAAWKIVAKGANLALTAPAGWQPPQPAAPVGTSDPFEMAAVPALEVTPAAAAGRATTWSSGLWRFVALGLLGGVIVMSRRLAGWPDPALMRGE